MSDNYCREETLIKYLPLVKKAARDVKVKSYQYDQEDLVNMGFIGLMDALDKFDPTLEVPFENYAYIRIRGSIIDEVRKNAAVPRSRLDKLNAYYKVKELMEQELQRQPTEAEICLELDINEKDLKALHETVHMLANISLDETLFGEDFNSVTRLDFIADEESPSPVELLINEELEELLQLGIEQLSEREQTILQLIYAEELPLKDIAHIFDISIPRVSQIHGQIILKLREYMENQ